MKDIKCPVCGAPATLEESGWCFCTNAACLLAWSALCTEKIAAVAAERDALREQVEALVAERDAARDMLGVCDVEFSIRHLALTGDTADEMRRIYARDVTTMAELREQVEALTAELEEAKRVAERLRVAPRARAFTSHYFDEDMGSVCQRVIIDVDDFFPEGALIALVRLEDGE